jgi:MprA protease rhombosortase-interaction domain-containing protein
VVTTVAGIGGLAGLLDGAGTHALFNQPKGLVLDGSGGLVVADSGNAAIRKIDVSANVSTPAMTQGETTTTITTGRGSTGGSGGTGGSTGGSSGGSSGGGGGGAISPWFAGLLALMGISRWLARKK